MSEKKTLTTKGITIPHALFLLLNFVGIGVTIYLTKHYFDVHFPANAGIMANSACDISSFFNCDAATFSPIAAIAGVPLGIFGLLISLIFIGGSLFPSEKMESTNKFLALLNALGCLLLLAYSLIVLKSLCPFCSAYYITSFIIFYLFWKKSSLPYSPSLKVLTGYLVFAAIVVVISNNIVSARVEKQEALSAQIIKQFEELPDLGKPEFVSPFAMNKPHKNIDEAPIWIVEFSDFQCPFCGRVAAQMEKIKRRYKESVNIYYYPYPLDNACNPEIKRAFHSHACRAARLAMCSTDHFNAIHDKIFENQASIGDELLSDIAKKYSLSNCDQNEIANNTLEKSFEMAKKYKVKSTPTMIINGKKIEGGLPTIQFYRLFDHILRKKDQ